MFEQSSSNQKAYIGELYPKQLEKLSKEIDEYIAVSWLVDANQANRLIANIKDYFNKVLEYDLRGGAHSLASSSSSPKYNCLTWAEAVLKTVELQIDKSGIVAAIDKVAAVPSLHIPIPKKEKQSCLIM